MARSEYEYDIFLSFTNSDLEQAKVLWEMLSKKGLRVFWSGKTLSEYIGDSWFSVIQESLLNSENLVVLWTNNAQNSEWVKKEIEAFYTQCHIGNSKERKIIPLIKNDLKADSLPPFLRSIQYAMNGDDVLLCLDKCNAIESNPNSKVYKNKYGLKRYFVFAFTILTINLLLLLPWHRSPSLCKSSGLKIAHDSAICKITFSPSGNRLVSTSMAGPAKLWDISKRRLIRILDKHQGIGNSYYSPKGNYLVVSSFPDNSNMFVSNVYSLPRGDLLFTISRYEALVKKAACLITADENYLILSSGSRTYLNANTKIAEPNILIISLPTGKILRKLAAPASFLSASPDSKLLLSYGSPYGSAQSVYGTTDLSKLCPAYAFIAWSISDGKCIYKIDSLVTLPWTINCIAVNDKFNRMFISAEFGRSKLSLFDLPFLRNESVVEARDTLLSDNLSYKSIFPINDGDSILVCDGYRILIYDTKDLKLVSRLDNGYQEIRNIVYTNKKKLVASILWDREYDYDQKRWKEIGFGIGIWDVSKNIRLNNIQYYNAKEGLQSFNSYTDIQISPKGDVLAIANNTGIITLWDLNKFTLIDSLCDKNVWKSK
jgi:WD40 repeat protein